MEHPAGGRLAVRVLRLCLLAFLLVLALPGAGQDENTPYFSLGTNRTFAPGDKPTLELWATNVDTLEFRLYRVNAPILFFRKLEDVHRFGGQAPRLPHKLTPIERFHLWKRDLRNWVRDVFRAQFSADSRSRIRDWMLARQRGPVSRVATYARVPLLNQQQVVAVWQQKVAGGRSRWESQTI